MLAVATRRLAVGAVLSAVLLGGSLARGADAWGYWGAPGSGTASATSGVLGAPGPASAVVTGSSVALAWSAPAAGVAPSAYVVERERLSDTARVPACGSSPSQPVASTSCVDAGVPDGAYRYHVTAVRGGWTAAAPASGTVQVDATPPAAPSRPVPVVASDTGVSSTDGITNDTTPTVTGTAEPGATVTVLAGSTPVGAGTSGPGGAYTLTTSALAEGTHILTARARDSAGNTGAASAGTTVVADTTAPAPVVLDVSKALLSFTLSGTYGIGPADVATVTVELCLGSAWPCTTPAAQPVVATLAPAAGTWSATFDGAPLLAYARAVQTDLAGNVGTSPTFGPVNPV